MKKTFNKLSDETIYTDSLSNGLRLCVIPKKGYIEKQAAIAVNYGSADIRYIKNGEKYITPQGVAHFLEHKLFEGEKGNAFDSFVSLGANVNAYTNISNTAYYFNCNDHFDECLRILLDFVSEPYFTDENIEKERGIIEQEIKMYKDNAYWRCYFNLMNGLYKECPVKYDIAGTEETIAAITKETLYMCYEDFYTSNNMILICAGDIDPENIKSLAEKVFGKNKKKDHAKIIRDYGTEPINSVEKRVTRAMELSRPIYSLGYKELSLCEKLGKSKEAYLTGMAGVKIMIDMMFGSSSDFFERRYADGTIDPGFSVEFNSGSFYGSFVFSGNSNEPDMVVEAISEEINQYKQNGFEKRLFEASKNKHIGRYIRAFNSIDGIVNGQIDLFSKDCYLFDILDAYERVNLSTVEQLIEVFKEDGMCLSEIKPKHL